MKIYYWIAVEISSYFGKDFFKENRVSWHDTRAGFQLVEKQYGLRRQSLVDFALLAYNARDTQTACKTVDLVNSSDFDPVKWKNREGFETYRKVAKMMCLMPRADNQAK